MTAKARRGIKIGGRKSEVGIDHDDTTGTTTEARGMALVAKKDYHERRESREKFGARPPWRVGPFGRRWRPAEIENNDGAQGCRRAMPRV